jgi:hypothetical protein
MTKNLTPNRLAILALLFLPLPAIAQYFFPTNILTPSDTVVYKQGITREYIYNFVVTSGKLRDSSLEAEVDFDSAGNILHMTRYGRGGTVTSNLNYRYDDSARLKSITTNYEWPKIVRLTELFFYDSAGHVDVTYSFNEDTSYTKLEKNLYDAQGHLLATACRFGNEQWLPAIHNSYDANGDLLEEKIFTNTGQLDYIYLNSYDHAARTKTVLRQLGSYKPVPWGTYYYDSLNRLTEFSGRQEKGEVHARHLEFERTNNSVPKVEDYFYGKDGTLFECRRTDDHKLFQIIRYYYTRRQNRQLRSGPQ